MYEGLKINPTTFDSYEWWLNLVCHLKEDIYVLLPCQRDDFRLLYYRVALPHNSCIKSNQQP